MLLIACRLRKFAGFLKTTKYQKGEVKYILEFEDLQVDALDQQEQNSDESEVDPHSKPSAIDLTTLNMGR